MVFSKRDINIFVAVMNGAPFADLSKEFEISASRTRQIFLNLLRISIWKYRTINGESLQPDELGEYWKLGLPAIRMHKEILIPMICESHNLLTSEIIARRFKEARNETPKELIALIDDIKCAKGIYRINDYEPLIKKALKDKIIDWRSIILLIACVDEDKIKSAIPPDSNSDS